MAGWLAALDERVKVCVDLCCLADFQALMEHRSLEGHGLYYFVPGLLKHFTSAQINALIAPRAHLSLAGIYDPLTPPDGLDRIDGELRGCMRRPGRRGRGGCRGTRRGTWRRRRCGRRWWSFSRNGSEAFALPLGKRWAEQLSRR